MLVNAAYNDEARCSAGDVAHPGAEAIEAPRCSVVLRQIDMGRA